MDEFKSVLASVVLAIVKIAIALLKPLMKALCCSVYQLQELSNKELAKIEPEVKHGPG